MEIYVAADIKYTK